MTKQSLSFIIFRLVLISVVGLAMVDGRKVTAQHILPRASNAEVLSSLVQVVRVNDGSFQYLINGVPQVMIGMGYNPIYRNLTDDERQSNYRRDFRLLCEAGVNHITGWDADKGYEQDKFDELTLNMADEFGIGVVMPFYLPVNADYSDPEVQRDLQLRAIAKIQRFKGHPALRMWGVGNEVLTEMPEDMYEAFGQFYIELADLFHELDPNHPVIYREAEDTFVPTIHDLFELNPSERPWLMYGANVYTPELERILNEWPDLDFNRPLFITEFGAEPDLPGGRAAGYADMWRLIRSHPQYVLGGAPYAWTTQGPEPVDQKWGLMDGESRPVDDTFAELTAEWKADPETPAGRTCGS